jgi:hypothetical protein
MRKLTIVFHDAGGGHRNAAEALSAVLAADAHPWEVELLNLQELLAPLDPAAKATGLCVQDGYNLLLRKGWTRLTPELLVLWRYTIRLHRRRIVRLLRNHWSHNPASLVLSVIPHFNRCLAESICQEIPNAAFVTLLTDLADYPPGFWIVPESEFLVCGSERARQQALSMGHPARRIYEMSGMVLKPSFYRKPGHDRRQERVRIGLRPDLPTGVVMFGGHGSAAMLEIAKRVDRSPRPLQLIFLCGHNSELADKIRALRLTKPARIESFTTEVPYFMGLADFFVGKPGPGSISEALQFGLPVIVEQNSRTMPQERYNGRWVREKRLGVVLRDFSEIDGALEQMLDETTFQELRLNVSNYRNNAVFEVPSILDDVMASKAMESWQTPSTWTPIGPFGEAAWAGLT